MKTYSFLKNFLFCSYLFLSSHAVIAQQTDTLQLSQRVLPGAQVEIYKQVGESQLRISIFSPAAQNNKTSFPAAVFFFGGGWRRGTVKQFEERCHDLAARGMVTMAIDYRVSTRQKSTPMQSVQDAKSVMRWVRKNAARLHIQPDSIVAFGGSAGGHLALAAAVLTGFNEPNEDTTISTQPNALVLFNPVVKTTLGGYGHEWLAENAEVLSPVAHLQKGVPPTLIFHGEADTTVPIANVEEFCQQMQALGNSCELHRFSGQKHGFFNSLPQDSVIYKEITMLVDQFLIKYGYLKPGTNGK